ncbi:MAG TPA: hypothetical protein VGB53_01365 [Rubricoccaceae bacterium]|jgi:hypothetical protein
MRSNFLSAAALVLAALSFASCDSADGPGVAYGGVTVEPVGGASLRTSGTTLVVSDIPAGAEGGFAVPGLRQRVDATIDPITVPDGGRFGTRVEAADGSEIASLFAVGLPQERVRFVFSFGAAAGVTAVALEYKLDGVTVFKLSRVPVVAGRPVAGMLLEQSGGEGSGKSGSVHAVRDGGRWVVVSDSEGSGQRPAGDTGGECSGFLVRPPAVAGVPVPDMPICVDWVEVAPLTGTAPTAARTVVVARGLPGFTVRTLAVQ